MIAAGASVITHPCHVCGRRPTPTRFGPNHFLVPINDSSHYLRTSLWCLFENSEARPHYPYFVADDSMHYMRTRVTVAHEYFR